ncbi:MAG: hypothetical protein HY602_01605 [Parcubacteria group bacterium]|nr:hypothetical protein [Parcubacteria group bacterium]
MRNFIALAMVLACLGCAVIRPQQAKLEKVFDTQIQTLEELGVPTNITATLACQRDAVIAAALKKNLATTKLPFVPVFPFPSLEGPFQLSMVKYNDLRGHTGLNLEFMEDSVPTPKNPYYIFNVEDGGDLLDKPVRQAEEMIVQKGRRCLNVAEVMAVALHSNVLERHSMYAALSRYNNVRVPILRLKDGRPCLDQAWSEIPYKSWGTPSCSYEGRKE